MCLLNTNYYVPNFTVAMALFVLYYTTHWHTVQYGVVQQRKFVEDLYSIFETTSGLSGF